MVEVYRFFNSTEGDERLYEADDFGQFFQNFLSNGFFMGLGVSPEGGNMDVIVSEGSAFIEGYDYANTDDLTLTHDSADAQYDRIDRIVIRLDRRQEERTIHAAILKGTAEGDVEAPELTRDDYIWELSIAQVLIEAGKSFIEDSQITDERGDRDVCGRVERPAKINDQVHSVDIKRPTTRAYQYHHEASAFYIHGDNQSEIFQEWLDSIGIDHYYGRDLSDLRMYVETYASQTDTGIQTVTIFDWAHQQNYQIYGKFNRASNRLGADLTWGSWHEEVLEAERVESSAGSYCIRYTNGQQVCYHSGRSITGVSNSVGALYRTQAQNWVVPSPFLEGSGVYVSITTTGNNRWAAVTGGTSDGETIPYRVFSAESDPSVNTDIRIKAEGRWR
ncbi:hypothetical protein HUG15_05770 [Salicibibacter cibarius]|uniref:Uncharacterized protein n=1 Tax=Salicibibacter cibarius TaxID=2743000 RepID=A0A7T6Z1T4_9BACI|nr:hypothetical protein [Salicibibacter cibarius]QQK75102.1 hypothetical protein HUG15_05440 [Salicibibacter cibarius]QQK75162.1 hypothetical protein HUG15_05770 [Salicibibacter cibarius]